MQPLVIAYHLIWTVYGWWLPNDLRGSGSKAVCCDVISELGSVHVGRKRVQPSGAMIRDFYEAASSKLKYQLLTFAPSEIQIVAQAFASVIQQFTYTCYGCAIMPDHVHLLIRKHKHSAEEMIANFQRESHLLLRDRGAIDMQHPVWGGHGWKVFLDEPDDIWRTIGYVEENPLKIDTPRQIWPFVKPYDNWPLHEGHNPNSPYARRLRGR